MEFAEIAGYGHSEQQEPEDVKSVSGNVVCQISFLQRLRRYITERISHFFPYINDSKYQVHFLLPEKFKAEKCGDFTAKVLKVRHPARYEKTSADLTAALIKGKVSGHVFSVLSEGGKKHIIAVLGGVEKVHSDDNRLEALYNNVHTMFRVMQEKYLYPEYFDNIERQSWLWREKGLPEEKISAMLKATNFNYEKVRKITGFYGNVQAYAGAAAYLMIKAVQSGHRDLVDSVEAFVLRRSAAMSESLLDTQNCILNCHYQVVKNLITQIKDHGAAAYLDPQGWVDWKKLYDYTLSEVKNIDYTPHAIMDVRQKEGKLLQALNRQYPDRRQMLNILQWCPEYKSSKILQDFIEAQLFYLKNQ